MLILSRRPGESLTIGDDVVVTVVGVKGNQIRLGITAPREVRVLRDEVHKGVWGESQAANAPDYDSRLARPARHLRGRKQIKSGGEFLWAGAERTLFATCQSEIVWGFARPHRDHVARFCPEDRHCSAGLTLVLSNQLFHTDSISH